MQITDLRLPRIFVGELDCRPGQDPEPARRESARRHWIWAKCVPLVTARDPGLRYAGSKGRDLIRGTDCHE